MTASIIPSFRGSSANARAYYHPMRLDQRLALHIVILFAPTSFRLALHWQAASASTICYQLAFNCFYQNPLLERGLKVLCVECCCSFERREAPHLVLQYQVAQQQSSPSRVCCELTRTGVQFCAVPVKTSTNGIPGRPYKRSHRPTL
jgi:hypothetical protein